uniref:Uncharacterized protein n=1 Tax=Trichobilharzia regenti TaxID=157069 RepID=A0AA85JXA2_TRIRE
MSSDNFKNLAYYLLTANYSSNQNKLTQPPSNNDSNNNNKGNNKINTPHSQKFQKKSLKHITTTAAVNNKTVSNGLSNANNSLPMQSNNIQRKKHYSFLITMLNRDSLLPESLWHRVYHQLCEDFIQKLHSFEPNLHQSASSISSFADLAISCLGRSFSLNHNIIHLKDIACLELFNDSPVSNKETRERVLSCLTEALANALSKNPVHLLYKNYKVNSGAGESYVKIFREMCKQVLESCLSQFEANYLKQIKYPKKL